MDELVLIGQIFGEGATMAEKLRAGGFGSLEKIAQADPAGLARSLKVTKEVAREIVQLANNWLDKKRKKKSDDLLPIKGVGESKSEKLRKGGFKTIESIASAKPGEISKKCNISISVCKKVVTSARKVVRELPREAAAMLEERAEEGGEPEEKKEARIIAFRRRLARLIVKELFN